MGLSYLLAVLTSLPDKSFSLQFSFILFVSPHPARSPPLAHGCKPNTKSNDKQHIDFMHAAPLVSSYVSVPKCLHVGATPPLVF